MTPHDLATREQAATELRLPEYPRITEVLDRIRTVATSTGVAGEAAAVAQHPIWASTDIISRQATGPIHVTHEVLAAEPIPESTDIVVADLQPDEPVTGWNWSGTVPVSQAPPVEQVILPEIDRTDLHRLMHMPLGELARETLRRRLIATAMGVRRRTAYELVFLMLAFATMVMIVAPPLTTLAVALHGKPVL